MGTKRLRRRSEVDWWAFERRAWSGGCLWVAGVDEAGRGPLAGPVVAAAVQFRDRARIPGVDDSKKLTAGERESLYPLITSAAAWGVGIVSAREIDRLGIRRATLRAMCEAVGRLEPGPRLILVDGIDRLPLATEQETLIGGDGRCFSIAAASIVAKVTRDRLMDGFDARFPLYGFSQHKGYGTRFHLDRLRLYGPCPIHRRTFRGVVEDARAEQLPAS